MHVTVSLNFFRRSKKMRWDFSVWEKHSKESKNPPRPETNSLVRVMSEVAKSLVA